jgi:hypothetical protein
MSEPYLTVQSKPFYAGHFFSDFISIPEVPRDVSEEKVIIIYGNEKIAQNFRKSSEKFFNHFNNVKVYDGGYLNDTTDQLYDRISEFIDNSRCLPIFIGISTELLNDLTAKWKLPLHHMSCHIKSISNGLSLYQNAFIGYQRHLCPYQEIMDLENHSYNSLSLGKMRTFPSVSEAVMRDASAAYIHFNVLKWSDCPFLDDNLPTGLTTEELCQISWFLGRAQNLKTLILDDADTIQHSIKSGLLATEVIWYFLEGLNTRNFRHPEKSKDFSEFIVLSENMDSELIFLKDNASGHWWLKIVVDELPYYMACTTEEYESTLRNDTPDRILKFIDSLPDSES